jgi:hypothetical protein
VITGAAWASLGIVGIVVTGGVVLIAGAPGIC